MATIISIQANVVWQATKSAASGRWLVGCEPLGIMLEADNGDEIHGLIGEAMDLLLRDLYRDSELEQFLRDRGWHMVGQAAPTGGPIEFDLPYELMVRGNLRDSQFQAA